jgi:N-acetylglucosaminyldiphosphoundecaprenol N-acetyl-beta-D-mannosaminyltransferase
MHQRDTIVLLGIPIDNLSAIQTVERIAELAVQSRCDGRPRHVATVNVDFLVNSLSWRPGGMHHPELLQILRRADLVTADGMPLVWLSRLLGTPLKERVTGADLVPLLARTAAERGLSVYLLGGRGDVGQRAAEIFSRLYPGIRIAGVDAPFVHTEGTELSFFDSEDQPVLERINRAQPDILLIAFGNPKQEIWFDRNRTKLRAGVSIGIGGTFEFIAGSVARAPAWMQRSGLEWIHRVLQEPRRLLKRYITGLLKFTFMALPSIMYYRYCRAILGRGRSALPAARQEGAGAARAGAASYAVFPLPEMVDAAYVAGSGSSERSRLLLQPLVALDFSGVKFIDSSGLGFLLTLMRSADESRKKIFFISIPPAAQRVFELSRTWDLVSARACANVQEIQEQLGREEPQTFYWGTQAEGACSVVSFAGTLDSFQAGTVTAGDILHAARGRDIIMNLAGLTFCDSTGIALFLKVYRACSQENRGCVICSAGRTVQQMLRMTKLDRLLPVAESVEDAREQLQKARQSPP